MEYSEGGWTGEAGREAEPTEGGICRSKLTVQENHREAPGIGMCRQGSPPRPCGSQGSGRGKGKVWKTSHQGKCLENSTFPPKFPSTATASGSDMEGKDRNKERESPEPLPRAPGTARAGSSLERPLLPGEMEQNKGKESLCSQPWDPQNSWPCPVLGIGTGIGLICTDAGAHWEGANLLL